MKKIFLILSAMILAAVFQGRAQDFSIISTDATAYPKIVVGVDVHSDEAAINTEFVVREEGREVPFNFSRVEEDPGEGAKAVCFLIEASGYTYGTPVENFRKAVIDAIGELAAGDKVNVCYFGKADPDGRSLKIISAEFTSDKDILISEIRNKVVAQRDTNRVADVFKSIYECLDFMHAKTDLPANKALVVISAAINNSRSPIKAEDCIDKANEFNIPVYAVTYKTNNRYAADNFVRISDKTGGKSKSAKTAEEISDVLTDFYAAIEESAVAPSNSYLLDFVTGQSGEVNSFEIQYNGQKQTGTFTLPEGSVSFWTRYMTIILVCIGLVLVIAFLLIWYFLFRRKKSRSANDRIQAMEQRNLDLQQQINRSHEAKQAPVQEPQKFDLKRTQIGGGGGTPMLMVNAGNFSKSFALNKPQLTIGRKPSNDIVIPELTVSGMHATLINENGNWILIDNNSTNGTYVNGAKINRQRISPADTVKLGAAFIKIQF